MKWFITPLITAAVCTGCSGGGKPVSPSTSVTTPVGTMHEMVHVPAGPFEMGSTVQSNEQPVHTVELDGYYIDTYEATNAQYEAHVTTGGGAASRYANNSRYNGAQQPVVGVDWNDAAGYCAWAGLRLPTEAEWEKAARGTDGRIYPWGDETVSGQERGDGPWSTRQGPQVACERAFTYDGGCGVDGQDEGGLDVGSKPAGVSPYGAHDMAGNVWEWTADWYDSGYYGASPDRNPTGPASGSDRVIRGGSWEGTTETLRSSLRNRREPASRVNYVGFRCAQDE